VFVKMSGAPPPPTGGFTVVKYSKQAIAKTKTMHTLLVIDTNPSNNYYALFKGQKGPDGEAIKVEQSQWDLLEAVYIDGVVTVTAKPSPNPIDKGQGQERTFTPDFILVRNFVLGLHGTSYLNTLMALRIANVPSVNSLDSIFFSTQRAFFIAELNRIQAKLQNTEFKMPYIPINYYPNTKEHVTLNIKKKQRLVAKVGTSHAGYGKMLFYKKHLKTQFEDFSTLAAMTNDYITTEPFIKGIVADIRIQKIGANIRAFKRVKLEEGWKGNVGESEVFDISPLPKLYEVWANECGQCFGGLDILSLDAVIDKEGKHTVLELNDTATGLNPFHVDEDMKLIRDLVLQRMKEAWEHLNKS